MKKYNRSEIFKKAWSLAKNYNMNMSEALRKAWAMAKITIFENELFMLNMKDISGGRTNIAAQIQISENNKEIERLTKKIDELKAATYPTITVTETYDALRNDERDNVKKRLAYLESMIEKAENEAAKFSYKIQYNKAKNELENSIKTYTHTVVDVNAYNDAA